MSGDKQWATDYVDVASRLSEFFAKFPDGSCQAEPATPVVLGDRTYLVVVARAYRTPDDPRPGVAQAWEPWPGRTPYTKDSEAMNAETSAVGRALAFLGFATKHVASADEVKRRRAAPAESRNTTPADPPPPPAEPVDTSPLSGERAALSRAMSNIQDDTYRHDTKAAFMDRFGCKPAELPAEHVGDAWVWVEDRLQNEPRGVTGG